MFANNLTNCVYRVAHKQSNGIGSVCLLSIPNYAQPQGLPFSSFGIEGQNTQIVDTSRLGYKHRPSQIQHSDKFQTYSQRHFSSTPRLQTNHVDPKKNYYSVLGVTQSCNASKIKNAYYRLSKIYHPDINKTEEAVKKFHDLKEAYEILSNTRLRQQYDDARMGHVHGGVYRGTAKHTHMKNYSGRGPPQKARHHQETHDAWMKDHYTYAFQKNKEFIDKKVFAEWERPRYAHEGPQSPPKPGVHEGSQEDVKQDQSFYYQHKTVNDNEHETKQHKKIVGRTDYMYIIAAVVLLVGLTKALQSK